MLIHSHMTDAIFATDSVVTQLKAAARPNVVEI
jgi:hypothetical protein